MPPLSPPMRFVAVALSVLALGQTTSWASPSIESAAIAHLSKIALPLESPEDLDPIVQRTDSIQLVLLGESSPGTSEFHAWRAELSKRLVREKGFRFIAVEGDWTDVYRINRYVKGAPGAEAHARDAMRSFRRIPAWRWANSETLALVEWLRVHNLRLPPEKRVGFYGLLAEDCGQSETALAKRLQRQLWVVPMPHLPTTCIESPPARPTSHPSAFEILERLLALPDGGPPAIVWADNDQIASIPNRRNLAAAAREALGADQVLTVGFGSASGMRLVSAEWGAPPEAVPLPPPLPGSIESLMAAAVPDCALFLFDSPDASSPLASPRPHRSIPNLYWPEMAEDAVRYTTISLPKAYDAFIFIHSTSALRPILPSTDESPYSPPARSP
jgi:erythromycin esterase-like protein